MDVVQAIKPSSENFSLADLDYNPIVALRPHVVKDGSSVIREMPQNYNNYIQAFREKDGIHGHQVRNCLSAVLDSSPSRGTRLRVVSFF